MTMKFEFRDMTDKEFAREQTAFDEYGAEFGNPPDRQKRLGYVATNNDEFVGASSGLAQKLKNGFGKYFFLSDLIVEKEYRKQGYGKKLLSLLETKLKSQKIEYIWTWTAAYEAEDFYVKQGYTIFTRFKNFYVSGDDRVGLIKKLK